MKVVLFCGGYGLRLRPATNSLPKPMISVGSDPILVEIMRYYAHQGHREFILCLGYLGDVIRDYFEGGAGEWASAVERLDEDTVEVQSVEHGTWVVQMVDTPVEACVGERLYAVRERITDDVFLANYGDVLTDAPVDAQLCEMADDAVASFLCVRPTYSFHVVELSGSSKVTRIAPVSTSSVWINGGYFVLRREIFNYMNKGDELVEEPFERLIRDGRLMAHVHEGFWEPMDTLKDRQRLEALAELGRAPWRLWEGTPETAHAGL